MRSFVVRVLAIAALVVGSTLPVLPANAAPDALEPAPTELTYACALKSNGQLRWVESLASCSKKETPVTVKPGPTRVCVQPSGSTRYVTSFNGCRPPATALTLPPTSGTVYFCAASSGVLRYVTDPSLCLVGETPLQATPNDAAPALVSSTPATGATGVGTTTPVALTFSEAVTAPAGAFAFTCDSTPVAFALTGSPGTVLTLTPLSALPEGASCSVTVTGGSVSDVDTLDPPDVMATSPVITFTTDAAPTLVSSVPANGAADVPVGDDIVLTFSEPVTVPAAALDLVCAASPVGFSVTGSNSSTITVNPTDALPAAASCLLTVTGSSVSDVDSGDPPDTMAADATVGFTTVDEAPTVVSTTPADAVTDVSTTTALSVTFSEPVVADTAAFTLTCEAASIGLTWSGAPATTVAVTPSGPLPTGVTCTWTIVAAQVTDVDTVDPPNTLAANTVVTFSTVDNNAPTAVDLDPRAVAENSPSGTTVGSFSTTDADPGDTFTYTLVAGTGSEDNALFAVDGTSLETGAELDAEDGARSVRVRSTDAAGDWVEDSFTITVTDVNEAPTDITLSNASVDENEPSGTAVGTLGGTDPDTGQTLTFTLVSDGCGGTYPGVASFAVDGTTLETAAALNHEVTPTIDVCVRATDSGAPGLFLDEAFTIDVNDVNDAPTTQPDDYTGAVGNTVFAVNLPGTPAPRVAITGAVLTANDSDEDGDTLGTVAETVLSTGGGTATIDAAGNFTFLPGVGDKSQVDTFTYTVTDGNGGQATGTVSVTIGAVLVWWVDNSSTAPSPDGRSTSPLTSTTPLNGPDATDVDAAGDHIFVYTGNATYGGGLRLESNQTVLSTRTGISVDATPLVLPGATSPVLTNASGNGIDLASGTTVSGVDIAGASGDGVNGVAISTASVGTGVLMTISGSGDDGIELSGAAAGAVTLGATVTTSGARSLAIGGRTGGTTVVSGNLTGKGVELSSNTGATISFTGALALTTTTTPAFSATGGGTVSTSGTPNTATGGSGGAVIVENTTIGATGVTFRSASATGAVNGIRLTNTGTSGGLTVTGTGSVGQGGDASGGLITGTSGPGILLTNTRNPVFNNVSVTSVATAAGIKGTGVDGFSFTNGRVSGSGLSGPSLESANLAFNGVSAGVSNLSGAVTVTNSVLENAYGSGVDVYNESGTISALTVSGNLVQSTASTATSKGHGVIVQSLGSSGGASAVTAASIANNRVLGFPSGGGVLLYGGNVAGAPSTTLGANSGSKVVVSGNVVRGASDATPMNTNCIYVSVAGRGSGFVDLQNNGTVGEPLGANKGNCISVNSTGAATLTSRVLNNHVSPGTGHNSGAFGIVAGSAAHTVVGPTVLNTAVLDLVVDGNSVSATKSTGIFLLTRDSGTLRTRVQNNTVAAPVELAGESGIVVNSGDQIAGDATVCLQIQNNTTAGSYSSSTFGTAPGIGLFKRGSVQTTNDFGVVGLTSTPTLASDVVTYVSSLNLGSAVGAGIYGASRAQVSGNNYVPCALPF